MNMFEELNKVDCSDHTEKKGQFTYLSWPFAVAELLKRHPEATWDVELFQNEDGDTMPYMATNQGYFVQVTVIVPMFNKSGTEIVRTVKRTQVHPVLDNRNKPIAEPTSFQINTSIMRCLVKAIALFGIGLYIYSGEDLPEGWTPDPDPEVVKKLNLAATYGTNTFREEWKKLKPAQRKEIPADMISNWKNVASEVDKNTPVEDPNE